MKSETRYGPNTIWWLDVAALPDLIWARSWIGQDGYLVQTSDGHLHVFEDARSSQLFLREDGYEMQKDLVSDRELSPEITPPESPWPAY